MLFAHHVSHKELVFRIHSLERTLKAQTLNEIYYVIQSNCFKWAKDLDTFPKVDDQQTHENMFDIINHWANATYNHTAILFVISINMWIDAQIVGFPHNRILHHSKSKLTIDSCCNIMNCKTIIWVKKKSESKIKAI